MQLLTLQTIPLLRAMCSLRNLPPAHAAESKHQRKDFCFQKAFSFALFLGFQTTNPAHVPKLFLPPVFFKQELKSLFSYYS